MLHENIKELARRSLIADKVMFGESKRRHPLGFEGFNIDLSIDHALSHLTSASYDSITALHMECANLTKAIKRTSAIEVSSNTLKLYKESRIADAFRKVIAFIKKCIKFIFKDLPLAIFRKIKAFFSRKSSKTKYAKAHEDAAKKRKDEFKETFDKMKERTDAMAEELIQKKKEVYSDVIDMESSKKNIDEWMKELDDAFPSDDVSKKIYRDSELRDLAEGLLNGIETRKISIDPVFKLGNFNYFKTPSGKALMELKEKHGWTSQSLNAFMTTTLLFACDAIPYITDTVQKYFDVPVKDYTTFPQASADAVVQIFYEQVRSFDQYIDGFRKKGKLPSVKNFTLYMLSKDYVDRLIKTMVVKDGSTRISLDAMRSLPSSVDIAKEHKIAPGEIDKGLRAAMITAVDLKQTMRTMSETADTLMHLKKDEIESYFDDGTSMEETLSYIGELVKAITTEIQTISSSVLRCIISLGAAEEKLLNALVSEDDAIHTITLSQLAGYIAKDEGMMKRVKALVMK